ncbi:MAG: flagellar cap protein FliD N-terminal domain-containing protein [Gammaproteobacteria bacterium]
MSSTITSTAANAGNTVISSTGIGSGLDITGIVTSLTTAAGLAQNTQLSDRKTTLTAQVSAYGTFQSTLATLQAMLTLIPHWKRRRPSERQRRTRLKFPGYR